MSVQEKMNGESVLFIKEEQTSFKDAFNANFDKLCLYAESIMKDCFVAEDIVVDCFVKFWEDRETIHVKSNVKNYLYCTVKNKCIDQLRKQARIHELKIEESIDISSLKSTAPLFYEPKPLETEELELKIKKAIDNLPEACRTIFVLNRFEGMKYKEIAKELNISVNTVEVQMGRALQKLRISLGEYLYVLLVF